MLSARILLYLQTQICNYCHKSFQPLSLSVKLFTVGNLKFWYLIILIRLILHSLSNVTMYKYFWYDVNLSAFLVSSFTFATTVPDILCNHLALIIVKFDTQSGSVGFFFCSHSSRDSIKFWQLWFWTSIFSWYSCLQNPYSFTVECTSL